MIRKDFTIFSVLFLMIFLLSGCSLAANNSWKKIEKKNKITFSVFPAAEPFAFKDENGRLVGYDIDVAAELAKNLGVKMEIKEAASFSDLFAKLENGEVQAAISSIAITSWRSENFLFSKPYFENSQVIIVRAKEEEISGFEDLRGHKVSARKGTIGLEEARKYTSKNLVFEYKDLEEAYENQEISAFICDYFTAENFIKKHSDLKIAGKAFSFEYYALATDLESAELVKNINKALDKMKNKNKFVELNKKWLEKK